MRYALNLQFDKMDFLDPLLTFQRASPATRISKVTGQIETVGPEVPRLEKDGLLIERESTNLLDHSITPGLAGNWGYSAMQFSTVAGLMGPGTAVKAVCMPATAEHFIDGYFSVPAGQPTICSVFVRNISLMPSLRFASFTAGELGSYSELAISPAGEVFLGQGKVEQMANGWMKVSLAPYTPSIDGSRYFRIQALGVGYGGVFTGAGESFEICCAQAEPGQIVTSYIPTTDAPADRVGETVFFPVDSIGINLRSGTWIFDAVWPNSTDILWGMSAAPGENGTYIARFPDSNLAVFAQYAGQNSSVIHAPGDTRTVIAMSYSPAGFSAYANGGGPATAAAPGQVPPITSIGIYGHRCRPIRALRYLPYALSDLSLQAASELD